MGRATDWLAAQRPAMVEILAEMQRGALNTTGGTRADLDLFFERLSGVAVGGCAPLRSIQAMRQAWWRWTTDGAHAATPPVQDLARIVRHAKSHGWLERLQRADSLALVDRLMNELEQRGAPKPRPLESGWRPTARMAVEGLFEFLEVQFDKRAAKESDGNWGGGFPPGYVVQEEVGEMLTQVVELILRDLYARGVLDFLRERDSFDQPFDGWPETLRELAATTSEMLNDAAKEIEAFEPSDAASPRVRTAGDEEEDF